ncbi:hypothetical protein CBER1_03692 [Cercospora berteroae]|uniref:F-box domain-containing protein n=1 Tax=Cercospora berteroae TaxID=357750 RepID=A0A2S6C7D9_9PEZI|nr:hypothetical protein CBER1_03692 [Cercospora berteroae]
MVTILVLISSAGRSNLTVGVIMAYLTDDLRCMKGSPAMRPEDAIVDTANADPQLSAPFFRLPQAIRKTIYSFVFGSGLIHVLSRECKSSDRWLPWHSSLKTFDFSSTEIVREYRKSSYAICQRDDWDRFYALSKSCGESSEGNSDHFGCGCPKDAGASHYDQRHSRCLRPIKDLDAGNYTSLCDFGEHMRTQPYENHVREDCEECKEVLARQLEQFGPPKAGGLAKLNQSTILRFGLLQVCRAIHTEASQLPYEQYTFHLQNCHTVEQFAGRVLTRRQAQSINSIQLDYLDSFDDLLLLQRSLPNLKQLRALSCSPSFILHDVDPATAAAFFAGNVLEKAELFLEEILNLDGSYVDRELLDFTEQLLVCQTISAARTLVSEWKNPDKVKGFRRRMRWLVMSDELAASWYPTPPQEDTVVHKDSSLRRARDFVTGFRSEHEIKIDQLEAQLAEARRELSVLKGAMEPSALDETAGAEVPCTSPISNLPPELLSRIFSFLDARADVASCRLTCHGFHEHSSPFLITQVVFAARIEAIARLFDVVDHPYFSKHVTRLLYDASFFDPDRAEDPQTYADLVRATFEHFSETDMLEMEESYLDLWRRIKKSAPEHSKHMISVPQMQSIMPEKDPHAHYYQGLYRYSMAFEAQRFIHESDLPRHIFQSLFSKLPQLRHISMGDWRNLARVDEDLDSLRDRLFGNMLAPTARGVENETESPWPDFLFLLEMCCYGSRGDLRSISIGGHPFCVYSEMYSRYDLDYRERPGVAFDTDFDILLSDDVPFEKLAHLKSLRLPLHIMQGGTAEQSTAAFVKYCQRSTFLKPLLQACSANLTYLELTAEDGGLLNTTLSSENLDLEIVLQRGPVLLASLLFAAPFTALKFLELRGWLFTEQCIKDFLITIRSTLRELRLLDNVILYNSEQLAKWGGENLLLDGVQIDNFEHNQDGRPYGLDLEEAWLAGRRNFLAPRALAKNRRLDHAERLLQGEHRSITNWVAYVFDHDHSRILVGPYDIGV